MKDRWLLPAGLRWLLAAAFGVSGATSLMLEVIWFRALGVDTVGVAGGVAAVTAAYMAGLALGSRLGASLAERTQYRLRWYGVLEGLVGICALWVPAVLQDLSALTAQTGWAWIGVGLVLLVPTTAMGCGLPLLATCWTRSRSKAATTSALLYGFNTAGAMLGVLFVGFVALPMLGPVVATLIAAALLVTVAIVAFVVSGIAGPQPATANRRAAASAVPRLAILGTAAAASGAAMLVQVAWSKLATGWLETPATGFAATVFIFLFGLSLGGFLAARFVDRTQNIERLLSAVLLGTGVTLGFGLGLGLRLSPGFVDGPVGGLIAVAPLLPATVCMGMLFPMFVSLAVRSGSSVGASVGNTSAASTVGAIAGSLLGAVLLPAVGAEPSVWGGLAIYACLGTTIAIRWRV